MAFSRKYQIQLSVSGCSAEIYLHQSTLDFTALKSIQSSLELIMPIL